MRLATNVASNVPAIRFEKRRHSRRTSLRRFRSYATAKHWSPETLGSTAWLLGGVVSAHLLFSNAAIARLESVNRPDLLPKDPTTVIDVAGFLTPGEEVRLKEVIQSIEDETEVKLRVLAQNYPETPGLAVRDYWSVDDDTVVFVADPTFGGILNFNVGSNIDLRVPRSFWSRLTGKFGNKFYWQERGESTAIINTVYAIDACLHESPSQLQCAKIEEK